MIAVDWEKVNFPNPSIIEKHDYFDRGGKKIFRAEYLPAGGFNSGVVLCSPFAEEKVRTLRIYVSLARALAAVGVGVVSFDYFGDGDSEGNFEEASLEDRLLDIESIFIDFRSRHRLEKSVLLGLRWGATLAALSAEKLSPDLLVLWEPIIDTGKFFYDYLRINLASQMLIEGKVSRNRDDLVRVMREGAAVTVEGYNITGRFYDGATAATLKGKAQNYPGAALIMQIAAAPDRIRPELETLRGAFDRAEIRAVPREFEWEKTETWRPAPPLLFGETFSFLERNGFFGRNIQS
ncbi:conserved hypothetical protein [Candidatus Zixiibacteriota bacterium]|nr:conserved hypothetical protein [candidate division Zixibacteria bacterium]